MGVIQIRQSSAQLGNLGSVKMVDTSGLAASPYKALEGLGKSVAKTVVGAAETVGDMAEWQIKLQEKEDTLVTNEALVKADEYVNNRLHNATDGVLTLFNQDSEQVPAYIKDPDTLIGNIEQEVKNTVGYDKFSRDKQRQMFDMKFAGIRTAIRKTLDTNANAIYTRRDQDSSDAWLRLTKDRAVADQTPESLNDFMEAFEAYAEAFNLSPEQRAYKLGTELKDSAVTIAKNNIAQAQSLSELNVIEQSLTAPAYGQRPDGSQKNVGWLGELKAADGSVVTEFSVGIDYYDTNGWKHNVDIPLVVPTLSEEETAFILNDLVPAEKDASKKAALRKTPMYQQILEKAAAHATPYLDAGKSPFYEGAYGALTGMGSALSEGEVKQLNAFVREAIDKRRNQLIGEQSAQAKEAMNAAATAYNNGAISYDAAIDQVDAAMKANPHVPIATGLAIKETIGRLREKNSTSEVYRAHALIAETEEYKRAKPKDKIAMLRRGVSPEVRGSNFFSSYTNAVANELEEVWEKERKMTCDTLIQKVITGNNSVEEAEEDFLRNVVAVYPEEFEGEAGLARRESIIKKIRAGRQANMRGYMAHVSGLLGNVDERARARTEYPLQQGQTLRAGVPLVRDSDGNIDINRTLADMEDVAFGWEADEKEQEFEDFVPGIRESLNCVRAADERVRTLAEQHPDWTTKQLVDLFDELVPDDVKNTLLIQEYSRSFDMTGLMDTIDRFGAITEKEQFYTDVLSRASEGNPDEPETDPRFQTLPISR